MVMGSNLEGGQEFHVREVEVTERISVSLLCCEAFRGILIGPEVDQTGMMIWPASHMLCAFLVSLTDELRGTHCVELGSGVGLCGIVASKLCHRTTLTDCSPHSLELLRINVGKNCSDRDVAVAELAWGDEQHTQAVLALRGRADGLVLCSDVLYPTSTDEAIRGLLQTSRTLLQGEPTTQAGSAQVSGPHSEGRSRTGTLVVSFIPRDGRATLRRFLRVMHTEAFRITEISDSSSSCLYSNVQARASGALIIVLEPCKQEPTLLEALARENSAFFAGIDEPDLFEEGDVWEQPFAES